MKAKNSFTVLILFFTIIYSNAQIKDIEILRDNLKYNISGKDFNYKRIKIKNNSRNQIIFWLTKSKESPEEYFGVKGDFSLKELLTEDSIENFNIYPIIFLDFIKIIKPHEEFYVLYNNYQEPFLNIYREKDLPADILSAIKYGQRDYKERFYQQNIIFLPDL